MFFDGGDEEVFGALDIARAQQGTLRAVEGWHRVEVDFEIDGPIDPASPPLIGASLRDWPLTIGGVANQHRLGAPFAVSCGNGVVQGNEECDDGNQVPGDGCDDQCMDDYGTGGTGTGGTGTGTGGTGGSELGPGEGCTCALGEPGGSGTGWLLGLLWIGLLVRVRSPRISPN